MRSIFDCFIALIYVVPAIIFSMHLVHILENSLWSICVRKFTPTKKVDERNGNKNAPEVEGVGFDLKRYE